MIKRSECRCICHTDAVALGMIEGPMHVVPCCENDIGTQMTIEDRPTLIYYVQTVYYTFKRKEEEGYHSRDRQYAIELLEKAMEHQNDIWNAAIEEAAKHCDEMGEEARISENIRGLKKLSDVDMCKHKKTVYEECLDCHWNAAIEAVANKVESAGNILLAHSVRELKK